MTLNADNGPNKELQTRGTFSLKPSDARIFPFYNVPQSLQSLPEIFGVKRFVQTIVYSPSMVDEDIFVQYFAMSSYMAFAPLVNNPVFRLYNGFRWKIKYTFYVTSVQQHVGSFYCYWYPGGRYCRTLAYSMVRGNTSTVQWSDQPGNSNPYDLWTLTKDRAIQLPSFKVFKLGKQFSFSLETEWNSPIPFHHNPKGIGVTTSDTRPLFAYDLELGHMAIKSFTTTRTQNITAMPTIEVWKELHFDVTSIPLITDSTIS